MLVVLKNSKSNHYKRKPASYCFQGSKGNVLETDEKTLKTTKNKKQKKKKRSSVTTIKHTLHTSSTKMVDVHPTVLLITVMQVGLTTLFKIKYQEPCLLFAVL